MARRNWLSRIYTFVPSTGSANSIYLGSPDPSSTLMGTNHNIMEMESHFDQVQLILGCMSSTHDLDIQEIIAIAPDSLTDHAQNAAFAATTYNFKVAGATAFVIPKRVGVSYPNVVLTDPLNIQSVSRTDIVGARPLLGFRILQNFPNGNTQNITYITKTGNDWATDPQIGWHLSRSGDYLRGVLPASPISSGISANMAVLGIRYLSRTRGMTVMWVGDSLTACAATAYTTKKGGGFPINSAIANSSLANPVEFINCGMSSQSATQYQQAATYLMPKVYPTHIVEEFWSPNSTTPGVSLPSGITTIKNEQATIFANALLIGAVRAMWNGLPECTNSTADTSVYGASDDLLRLSTLADQAALGYPTLDFDSVVKSPGKSPEVYKMIINGDAENFTADGLHPNQACDDAVLTPAASDFVAGLATTFRATLNTPFQVRIPGGGFSNGVTGNYQVRIPGGGFLNQSLPSDTTAPSIPANLEAASITSSSVVLNWDPSTDDVAVAGYRIFQDAVEIGTSVTNSFGITGLSEETEYLFSVSAYDASGNESDPSDSLSVTTSQSPDVIAPSAPTELVASNILSSSFTLSWTASTDDRGVAGYRVFIDGVEFGTSASTSLFISGLNPATTFSMTVVAYDATGNESDLSDAIEVQTLIAVDLTTLERTKSFLHIDDADDDENLQMILTAVSVYIQKYCNRDLIEKEYIEYHNGFGNELVVLENYPVTEVATLHDDTSRAYASNTLIPASEYVWWADGRLELDTADTFATGKKNIRVRYTAGYDQDLMPYDLQLATWRIIQFIYKDSQTSIAGPEQLDVAGMIMKFRNSEVHTTLDRYRKIPSR